jgi:adenylate kinase family enzyme
MPLKLAVVGAPFSGKTSVAQALAQQYKLKLIEPEALVADAMAAGAPLPPMC